MSWRDSFEIKLPPADEHTVFKDLGDIVQDKDDSLLILERRTQSMRKSRAAGKQNDPFAGTAVEEHQDEGTGVLRTRKAGSISNKEESMPNNPVINRKTSARMGLTILKKSMSSVAEDLKKEQAAAGVSPALPPIDNDFKLIPTRSRKSSSAGAATTSSSRNMDSGGGSTMDSSDAPASSGRKSIIQRIKSIGRKSKSSKNKEDMLADVAHIDTGFEADNPAFGIGVQPLSEMRMRAADEGDDGDDDHDIA